METILHSTNYDEQLKAALPHLVNYPQLLPFIGNCWSQLPARILLIAESHYLPDTCNAINNSQTWYDEPPIKLTAWDKLCITTRRVITNADNYLVTDEPHNKSFQLFYSLKNAILDKLAIKDKRQTIFQHFGFYNYFQRPAEISGESINNTAIDDQIAYDTLKAICNIIEPTALIFTSRKAYLSFKNKHALETEQVFKHIEIQNIVHPASSWWNKKSSKLSVNGEAETGKEKFMRTLGVYKFQLADTVSN